jgi:1-acyl-sn-glycerol-3-phosphate acyltransferase
MIARIETEMFQNLAAFFMGGFKLILFISMMFLFIVHHSIVGLFIWSEDLKLKYFLRSISLTSKVCLRILNIKVNHQGAGGEVTQRLIVANHLSYLDVLILFSHYPSLFVTSVEIQETPILGRICRLSGCFFVERRKERRTESTKREELELMKTKLAQGNNIFLFPEGTSSDGVTVLPFKNTFFQLSIDTNTTVLPICLKYIGLNAHISPWYGDMTFLNHLTNICFQKEIQAELIVLPELSGTDRIILASETHKLISESYAKY